MKKLTKTSFIFLSLIGGSSAWAFSPPNINTDIKWTDTGGVFDYSTNTYNATFNGVIDIAAAYNHARRQEEIQLGLSTNQLGNLDLPTQSIWGMMTDDAKALLILNEERQDRAGMQAGVIGLPLAGIESHMDTISKNYGDLLHDTNKTNHYQPSGNSNINSPFKRIEQDADIGTATGCHEFIARSENLAYFATQGNTNIPIPLERAIYGFIYDDAGSAWGHREAALLQDETLAQAGSGWGFSNNYGNSNHEGFLGIAVRSSTDYKPFPSFASDYATVVVMNFFDPIQNFSDSIIINDEISPIVPINNTCHYNVTLNSENVETDAGRVPTISVPHNQWMQIGLNTQPATGSTVADILGDDISGTYSTDWAVFSYQTDTNSYNELSLTDPMETGIGYWLIQATGSTVTIDMPSSSSGVYVTHSSACSSTEGCFEIPLQVNADGTQWQMVAYPFRDSRNMDKIKVVTDSGTCASGCTLSEASTLVSDRLWHYEAGTNGYLELFENGSENLDPWDGAWFAILPAANGLAPKLLIPANN